MSGPFSIVSKMAYSFMFIQFFFCHITIALLRDVLFLYYILKLEHSTICSMFYSLFVFFHIACERKVY